MLVVKIALIVILVPLVLIMLIAMIVSTEHLTPEKEQDLAYAISGTAITLITLDVFALITLAAN